MAWQLNAAYVFMAWYLDKHKDNFVFYLTYLLTYLLTYSMVHDIIWKADCQLVKNILLSYGTRRFITVFTQARHWNLSWASWIQFAPSIPTP
jgi:hypothetical protein